jgi:hypothetical protein
MAMTYSHNVQSIVAVIDTEWPGPASAPVK